MELAIKARNIKATNLILMGILDSITTIVKEAWKKAIEEIVPKKLLDINLKAFELGDNH